MYDTDCLVIHVCGAPLVLLHQGDMHLVGAFDLDMADKIRAALVAALTDDETTDARRAPTPGVSLRTGLTTTTQRFAGRRVDRRDSPAQNRTRRRLWAGPPIVRVPPQRPDCRSRCELFTGAVVRAIRSAASPPSPTYRRCGATGDERGRRYRVASGTDPVGTLGSSLESDDAAEVAADPSTAFV